MIESLWRKARQVVGDPVLRRWLIGRAAGVYSRAPAFAAHRPSYADALLPLATEIPAPPVPFDVLPDIPPTTAITLPLAGRTVRLEPGQEETLFTQAYDDREVSLAIHRFAWLPLIGEDLNPAWVVALWRAWRQRHGEPGDDWAWHPYTAAERAINIIDFARRHGLPGAPDDTLQLLAAHGPAIARRLEYFGDHHTSNHLANNGRGLYLLGLELGLKACADIGARLLIHEAQRIFTPSGILREGSSHYHLLLAKQYASAWLAARAHGRPEAEALRRITIKALAVVPRLMLPGGLPLIGDISPDCPPEYLDGLIDGRASGWLKGLAPDSREAFQRLSQTCSPVSARALAQDGWLRADFAPWAGLWHAAPGGWSHMPGHGHQDLGGFEVHHEDQALFIDPGRGAYGDDGEAAFYVAGLAHNTLLVDDADPYPPNKPYYDDVFRRRVGGPAPELHRESNGVRVRHHGFARLGGLGDVGTHTRRWRFGARDMTITDAMEGRGKHRITRSFHTVLQAERDGETVILRGGKTAFRLHGEGEPAIQPSIRWTAYGQGQPATTITFATTVRLPWESTLRIDVL